MKTNDARALNVPSLDCAANYDELIESLSRLANAGLRLHIATQQESDMHRSEETGSD